MTVAALAVLLAASLGALYAVVFREYPRISDSANTFLAASDMAAGNWRLNGWWLPSDTFWTSDVLFEALLIRTLGPDPQVMVLLPAMLWAGVVAVSAVSAGAGRAWPAGGLLLVAVVLGLPVLRANDPMSMISYAPVHVGSILYILAMFSLAARAAEGSRASLAATACVCTTALAVAGDPLVLFLGVAPVAVAAGLVVLARRDRGHAYALAGVLGGALLGKAAEAWNQAHGGFHIEATPLAFVPFDKLGSNIARGLYSILLLTGTNFFGRTLADAAPFIVRLPVLLLMAGGMALAAGRYGRQLLGAGRVQDELPLLDRFLLLGALLNVAAALLSSLLVDAWSARYFLPALVFTAILAARTLPRGRWVAGLCGGVLAATVAAAVVSYTREPLRPGLADPGLLQLADRLAAEGLTDGYASYWSASIITVATHGQVRVRAVDTDGSGRLVPKRWLAKEDWFAAFGQRRPFFVVADKSGGSEPLNEEAIAATFGKPSRRYDLADHVIVVFDPSK